MIQIQNHILAEFLKIKDFSDITKTLDYHIKIRLKKKIYTYVQNNFMRFICKLHIMQNIFMQNHDAKPYARYID